MSAVIVELRPGMRVRVGASEVPAVIAGSVNLLRFSEALARAGLVGRHDPDCGLLVIEPVPARMIPADAEVGIRWWNRLTPLERRYWLDAAGSAVPADAWRKFQSGWPPP